MARKPNMQWRKGDAEKLEDEIRKFNAKIYRTRRRHPELADIQPETIKKADKLKMIEDFKQSPRAEFNKTLNELTRYREKGAELPVENAEGVTTTVWNKKEITRKTTLANKQKAKEREILDIDLDTVPKNMMNDVKVTELKPRDFDFNKIKSKKELEMFERAVKRQSRVNRLQEKMDEYKKSYLYTVDWNLGSQGKELYDFIKNVPSDILYGKYFEDDPVLKIQFASDPLPASQIQYEALKHWKNELGDTDFMKYYKGEDLDVLEALAEDYEEDLVKAYLREGH